MAVSTQPRYIARSQYSQKISVHQVHQCVSSSKKSEAARKIRMRPTTEIRVSLLQEESQIFIQHISSYSL